MRRLVRGVPRMLLAALWLFVRLTGPAAAMPVPADVVEQIALHSLCHGGSSGEQAPDHHDCLSCPMCHSIASAAVPAPGGPSVREPVRRPLELLSTTEEVP